MNNFIYIIGLIVVVVYHVEANSQGFPIRSLSPRVLSARASPTCKNVYGPICGDCNTLWTCLGTDTPFKIQSCEKSYPGKPYCVDGACGSSPDKDDEECSATGITCTGSGYFPNPSNCSQYYFCEGPRGASMAYECPPRHVYKSLEKECKRQILSSDCTKINCASNTDQFVGYPPDPSYYVMCLITDGTSTPIAFKCALNEQFIPSERKCVFQCKKEGRAADGKDCTKYYECYRNGFSFVTMHQKCLNGFIFSSEANGCVKGTCPVDEEEETGSGGGSITN